MEEAKGHVTARAEGVVVIIKASLEKGEATRFSVAISGRNNPVFSCKTAPAATFYTRRKSRCDRKTDSKGTET